MNIDERLEKLLQDLELMKQRSERRQQRWKKVEAAAAKHEQWRQKIWRGIDAALREWRNGEAQ